MSIFNYIFSDLTDSGPIRSTYTLSSVSTQITTNNDTGQQIDSNTLPRSPSSIVKEKALSTLAANIGAEWEPLAIHMGFKPNKLYHWKEENSTVWGQVFAMLSSWKNQNANRATISQLLAVLHAFRPPLDPGVYRHLYFE